MVRRFVPGQWFAIVALTVALVAVSGCTEERKREAARLAAELEAKERQQTQLEDTGTAETMALRESAEQQAPLGADTQLATTAVSQDSLSATPEVTPPQKQIVQVDPKAGPTGMPPMIKDGFTVQVESSPHQPYIMEQLELYTSRGYDAYLGTITRDGRTYYRLRIGKYTNQQEAQRVSAELNSMYNLQTWVDEASW